jgi:hypothetical protein
MSQAAISSAQRGGAGEPGASEVAWTLAALIPELSYQTCSDLRRLLARSVTVITPSERREARLGLLVDLVTERVGEVPSVADYENGAGAMATATGQLTRRSFGPMAVTG